MEDRKERIKAACWELRDGILTAGVDVSCIIWDYEYPDDTPESWVVFVFDGVLKKVWDVEESDEQFEF